MTDTLEEIAAELYAVAPDAFVSARNERAKGIADRELAAGVKGLRKPLAPAWVVNLFARERPGQLAQALELAEALREAQEDLDAKTLTALSRQRRTLVTELARAATGLAEHTGVPVSAATTEAVAQTLNAAMLDAAAADAVASGRLIRALEPSGADAVDISDAVAGAVPHRPVRETPPDELSDRRARKEAEKRVRSAEQQVEKAERRLREAEREHDTSVRRRDDLRREEADLEAELERVRASGRAAADAVEHDQETKDAAERELTAARDALADERAQRPG
ncbi:transposase [Microbacterium sp. GXF0217]